MSDQPANDVNTPSKEDIFEELKGVEDPELRMSVVELGLIYDVNLDADGIVTVDRP
jgi:metal-sulfur cluster biosynthetic enzyme